MNIEENPQLHTWIEACKAQDRQSQKELYKAFFSYAMSVCLRYANNKEEAKEILNDSFLKVFSKIHQLTPPYQFKAWLRRILVNTSIDYLRRNKPFLYSADNAEVISSVEIEPSAVEHLSEQDLLKMIQELPPTYRTVFNLFAIEGYSHEEIAKILQISVGTSKSNLHKARRILQKKLSEEKKIYFEAIK
ncbi:MAG: sigma-70 family RNA polymerase sigma factor [Raineya sp.]